MAIMRKEAKSKRKREEKRGKGKKSGKKGKKARKSKRRRRRKQEKRRRKREKKGRKALRPVFLQKTKRSAYGLVAQGLDPLQPAYFDILALAFSTSSSLGRGSFLASITTWKTKSVTHFCEKSRRWLY